jgi:hypothetical protein
MNGLVLHKSMSEKSRTLQNSFSNQGNLQLVKQCIWLYFFLLIFEGGLRKWVLPGLATPLLIIRDPVAFGILVLAVRKNILVFNSYVVGMYVITITAMVTAVFLGHKNLFVALYGARIVLLHFPVMFVIGKVFSREDVLKMGRIILWLSLPMTILILLQFYSPQSAWVNRGVGGEVEGTATRSGLQGALGYFRPPGTFSFATGTSSFYALVAPFLFFFWLQLKRVNKLLLIAASICLMMAIPLSISRSLFFQVSLTLVFVAIALARKPKLLGQMLMATVGVSILLVLLSKVAFFQTATMAFTARFETASEVEGGLQGTFGDRYLGGMTSAIAGAYDLPFFGVGIGMGTNVGSQLLSGQQTFLVAEGEWGRVIGEMGLILGFAMIFYRLKLVIKIAIAAYKKLLVYDTLPWLLLSFGFITVAQSQWAQPTSLGFSTLIGGLMIASLNKEGDGRPQARGRVPG